MTSFQAELEETVQASAVRVTDETITVDLEDGRTVTVPTAWYPRLLHANAKERANYEIDVAGISWPDVEADFSIKGILLGRKSGENPESFKYWLDNRRKGRRVTVELWLELRQQARHKAKKRKSA